MRYLVLISGLPAVKFDSYLATLRYCQAHDWKNNLVVFREGHTLTDITVYVREDLYRMY